MLTFYPPCLINNNASPSIQGNNLECQGWAGLQFFSTTHKVTGVGSQTEQLWVPDWNCVNFPSGPHPTGVTHKGSQQVGWAMGTSGKGSTPVRGTGKEGRVPQPGSQLTTCPSVTRWGMGRTATRSGLNQLGSVNKKSSTPNKLSPTTTICKIRWVNVRM